MSFLVLGCAGEHPARADERLTDLHSHSSAKALSADRVHAQGILRNYNTIEDFKNADKTALLDSLGDEVRRLRALNAEC